jgi:DNA replication protein DnaC
LIITSNQPFNEWDKIFTDSSMTVAAIDRVVHHSIIIEVEAKATGKERQLIKITPAGNHPEMRPIVWKA